MDKYFSLIKGLGQKGIKKFLETYIFFENSFTQGTVQMFTGIYGGPAGKLECGDFRIAGFACISAFSINSVGVPFMDFAGKL